MAREDFVTESPKMFLNVELERGGFTRIVQCVGCRAWFDREVLGFYWERSPLCWDCAPAELQAFARVAYAYGDGGVTTKRWMAREEGRDHLIPEFAEMLGNGWAS